MAPATATPSVCRTIRDVEAIAEATPARARGIPDTAALVTGALTNPKPNPTRTYVANSCGRDVAVSIAVSMTPAVARQTPEITSGRRGPRRPTMRPDSGDAATIMAANGTVASP